MIELFRKIQWVLLAISTFITVSACGGGFSTSAPISSDTAPSPVECQAIQHDLGETCVPNDPQRLAATGGIALEVLLALDRKPLAAAEPNLVSSQARHIAGKDEGIASLGKERAPNLEKLEQLKT